MSRFLSFSVKSFDKTWREWCRFFQKSKDEDITYFDKYILFRNPASDLFYFTYCICQNYSMETSILTIFYEKSYIWRDTNLNDGGFCNKKICIESSMDYCWFFSLNLFDTWKVYKSFDSANLNDVGLKKIDLCQKSSELLLNFFFCEIIWHLKSLQTFLIVLILMMPDFEKRR